MKTQGKNLGFQSQKKNNRWKWMAGATAATAAGVTTSHASLVTINLTNNYIASDGNHLNADLTGDGHPDLTIANAFYGYVKYASRYYVQSLFAGVTLNGIRAYGVWHSDHFARAILGSHSTINFYGYVLRRMRATEERS